jgi:DNA (cytosine-5)-methyltransferase 1
MEKTKSDIGSLKLDHIEPPTSNLQPLTLGSLFSGIGGFELGFERTGKIQTIWQVEIDAYCRRVLAKHWPTVQRFADIRECCGIQDGGFCHKRTGNGFTSCNRLHLEPVDILSGGFPCQDISNAGKRAGIDGERSGLWSEYARIIRELRPRYVVVENVAALLGRGMGRVLGDLAACGYDAEWQSIRASDVGAPHRRERIWIVAYPQRSGIREQSIFGTECGGAAIPFNDRANVAHTGREHFDLQQRTQRIHESAGSGADVADADSGRFAVQGESSGSGGLAARSGKTFPHTEAAEVRSRFGEIQSGAWPEISERSGNICHDVPHAASGQQRSIGAQCDERRFQNEAVQRLGHSCDWSTEPDVGRVAHGVPARVDHLRGLGNAIVPQIAEFIGWQIWKFEVRSLKLDPIERPTSNLQPPVSA